MSLSSFITLGGSGLRVSPFCLGSMTFGEDLGWGASVTDSEVKDSIRDCFIQVGNLGFVSHFVPTAYRSLDRIDALVAYDDFRKAFL